MNGYVWTWVCGVQLGLAVGTWWPVRIPWLLIVAAVCSFLLAVATSASPQDETP